jgi:hypothetical protein
VADLCVLGWVWQLGSAATPLGSSSPVLFHHSWPRREGPTETRFLPVFLLGEIEAAEKR